jgi:hypothetical protein
MMNRMNKMLGCTEKVKNKGKESGKKEGIKGTDF